MKIAELSGKKIAVVGLGKEGLANLKLLRKIGVKEVGLFDQKAAENLSVELQELVKEWQAEGAKIRWYSGADYLKDVDGYEVVIKSPGVSPREENLRKAVEGGMIFTSATRIFLANRKGRVIGITGSKGKSTTSTLIYLLLKKAGKDVELIGNIGNTALDYLANDSAEKIYVFELSSYQLEDLEKDRLEMGVLVSFFSGSSGLS
jgi:UDP-N-acetylmuramoylalanine-D-glutamate ligase